MSMSTRPTAVGSMYARVRFASGVGREGEWLVRRLDVGFLAEPAPDRGVDAVGVARPGGKDRQ